MPHYWFRIPLSSTAPHLKEAKQRGGAPEVTKELRKDAHNRRKAIRAVHYDSGVNECEAAVFSPEPMESDDCNWFHERWQTGDTGCPPARYDPDETVDESRGWRFEPPTEAS